MSLWSTRLDGASHSVVADRRPGLIASANLNVHFHVFVFDGVYTRATATSRPTLRPGVPPTHADITVSTVAQGEPVERKNSIHGPFLLAGL
jgi:hypothetical protein